jgi:hypothetical protein
MLYTMLLFIIYLYFTPTTDGFINEYSHTVNMPLNDIYSCKNFCGPKSQCAITRDQCTSDIDCVGCVPPKHPQMPVVSAYEDSGKLSSNQGLHYSSLTTGYGTTFEKIVPVQQKRPYEGYDIWTQSFNEGLRLYNKKRTDNYGPTEKQIIELPTYPTTITATGLFYNTGPTPSNAVL